jgi:hypothetical protein
MASTNMQGIAIVTIWPLANATATAVGSEVSLQNIYLSPGAHEMAATWSAIYGGSDTGTATLKLQESTSSSTADYADITGAAFTAAADTDTTAVNETIYFKTKPLSKYIRGVCTISGTSAASFYVSCKALIALRSA